MLCLASIYYLSVSPQIRAEIKRVVTMDLLESFLDGLDGLVPRLLEMYKAVTTSGKKQALKDILDCHEKDVSGRAVMLCYVNVKCP